MKGISSSDAASTRTPPGLKSLSALWHESRSCSTCNAVNQHLLLLRRTGALAPGSLTRVAICASSIGSCNIHLFHASRCGWVGEDHCNHLGDGGFTDFGFSSAPPSPLNGYIVVLSTSPCSWSATPGLGTSLCASGTICRHAFEICLFAHQMQESIHGQGCAFKPAGAGLRRCLRS